MTELTILMPCLNEIETLEVCITKAQNWLSSSGVSGEILIADNGSTDGSQSLATSLGARVIDVPEKGYGSALFTGCSAAKGKYIIMGDSDDSYDFSQLDNFYNGLKDGHDLVMGNRFKGGIEPGAMPWKNKYIGNPFLTFLGRTLFKTPSSDFHCGLRGISKQAFEELDLRTTGMEFASEMVIKASVFGLDVVEVPTTLNKDGRSRPPHLRPWRDGWRHLRFMTLFSPKWLFFIPGLALSIICFLLYLFLLTGPISFGSISLDLNSLFITEAGVVSGFTWASLGLVARIVAMREGLLAPHTRLVKIQKAPSLELGGLLGLAIWALGVILSLIALGIWGSMNFGAIENGQLLRIISASTLLTILGSEIIAFSLLIGFLSLPTRNSRKQISQ